MLLVLCISVVITYIQARSPPIDVCMLPKETGHCKASMPRYFYNRKTNRCEIFTYGGCGGNDNNFKSQRACKKRCEHFKQEPLCGPVCMIYCPYGNVMNSRGCPTCRCNPEPFPCPMPRCLRPCHHGYRTDGKGCQTCSCLPGPFPPPRPIGKCPKGTESNIECPMKLQHGCKSDNDCIGSKKCCTYGCTRKCVRPRYDHPIYPMAYDKYL